MTKSQPQPKPMYFNPYPDDLSYLQDEMKWLHARCERIFVHQQWKKSSAKNAPPKNRWGETLESSSVLSQRLNRIHEQEDHLRSTIDKRIEDGRHCGTPLALDRIVTRFHLSEKERWTILLAISIVFSRSFETCFGKLLGDERLPSPLHVEVVFAFLELDLAERIRHRKMFSHRSRLIQHDILHLDFRQRYQNPEDLLQTAVVINSITLNYILGEDSLGDDFMEFSSLEEPKVHLEDVVLPNEDKRRITALVDNHDAFLLARTQWGIDDCIAYGRGLFLLFHGSPGTGKTMTAHGVAKKLGKKMLNVDVPTFLKHQDANRFLPGLFREARLRNALLFFDECELLFADRRLGNDLMTILLTEIERFEGVAILATNMPEELDPALARRMLLRIRFSIPNRVARQAIWSNHLPSTAPLAKSIDVQTLAAHYELTGGLIKNAVLSSVMIAIQESPENPIIQQHHLEMAAREQQITQCFDPNIHFPKNSFSIFSFHRSS